MNRRTLLRVIAAGCLSVTSISAVADSAWLTGTWWYADSSGRVIEGDDKDGMVFRGDGTVDLVDETGRPYLNCVYMDTLPRELSVKCLVRGQVRELTFRIGENRSKLSNVADEDHGAYVRS